MLGVVCFKSLGFWYEINMSMNIFVITGDASTKLFIKLEWNKIWILLQKLGYVCALDGCAIFIMHFLGSSLM